MKNGMKILVALLLVAVLVGGAFIFRGIARKNRRIDLPYSDPTAGQQTQTEQPEQPEQSVIEIEPVQQEAPAAPAQPDEGAQTEENPGEQSEEQTEPAQPETPYIVENEGDLEIIIPDDMDQGGL